MVKRVKRRSSSPTPANAPVTPPTLADLHNWYEFATIQGRPDGIVGNYNIRLLTAIAWGLEGCSVNIRGESGAGKTRILNATEVIFFGDDSLNDKNPDVFTLTASSDKGQLTESKANRISSAYRAVIPELQAAYTSRDIKEMMKRWMEDRAYQYDRYSNESETKRLSLPPLPILTNLAEENDELKDLGAELNRRMFSLWVKSTANINDRVQHAKAQREFMSSSELKPLSQAQVSQLREHLLGAVKDDRRVINPGADALRVINPSKFTMSNSFIDFLFATTRGITKFYAYERLATEKILLAAPADNVIAEILGGDAIRDLSIGLQSIGREILAVIPLQGRRGDLFMSDNRESAPKDSISIGGITDALDKNFGITYPKKNVEILVNRLVSTNFVKYQPDAGLYFRTTDPEEEQVMDVNQLKTESLLNVEKRFPELYKGYSEMRWLDYYLCPFCNKEIKIGKQCDCEYTKEEV